MRLLAAGLRNVWEFVVGDDWRTAAGVVATLALTAAIAQAGVVAWWVVPVGVVALLTLSIRRAMRLR
jgi:ABC-type branched-subunit amino acid transport system substrate-binding protein